LALHTNLIDERIGTAGKACDTPARRTSRCIRAASGGTGCTCISRLTDPVTIVRDSNTSRTNTVDIRICGTIDTSYHFATGARQIKRSATITANKVAAIAAVVTVGAAINCLACTVGTIVSHLNFCKLQCIATFQLNSDVATLLCNFNIGLPAGYTRVGKIDNAVLGAAECQIIC